MRLSGEKTLGFLKNNQIISHFSEKVPCEKSHASATILNGDLELKRSGTKISMHSATHSKINLKVKEFKRLLDHHDYLLNGTSIYEDLDLQINKFELFDSQAKQTLLETNSPIFSQNYFSSILKMSLRVVLFIIGFLILLILIFVSTKLIKFIRFFFKINFLVFS